MERQQVWHNHGCPPGAIYGDDGEMQCSACGLDFLRDPWMKIIIRLRNLAYDKGMRECQKC